MTTNMIKCRTLVVMVSAASLAAATLGAAADTKPPTDADRANQSRALSKDYGKRLKGTLLEAIEAGGPEAAIAVCNTAAPAIAKVATSSSGWSLGRTALKVRNPENAPDAWERDILLKFQDQAAQGADMAALEHYETTTKDGKRVFRYMKAIPTGAPCLTCHGSNLSPSVKAKIDELYPEDQATGFAVGDLRGAFTIVQPLP